MNFHAIKMLLLIGSPLIYLSAAFAALVGSKVPTVREIFPERYYRTAMTFTCAVWPLLAAACLISGQFLAMVVVLLTEIALIFPLTRRSLKPKAPIRTKSKEKV